MFNISYVKIKAHSLPLIIYDEFLIKYAFGGNSSLVSISNGKAGIGSGHWISENSDCFLFSKDSGLVKMELSVPNKNIKPNLNKKVSCWGEILFQDPRTFLVTPTKLREFSAQEKELTCLNFVPVGGIDYVFVKEDFYLVFSDGKYCGYRLRNPIRYLCESVDEALGLIAEPDDAEYYLMEEYFSIMSDNKLDELSQDMRLLVLELNSKITPQLRAIQCARRRKVVEKTIVELLDFYA